MSLRPIAGVDLAWAGERIVVAVGPLNGLPSRAALSRALATLISLPATSRIAMVPSPSGRTWRSPAPGCRVPDNVHELPEFADPATAYVPLARLKNGVAYGDYLHLARVKEWMPAVETGR